MSDLKPFVEESVYKTDYEYKPSRPAKIIDDNQVRTESIDIKRPPAYQVNSETLETYKPEVYVPFDLYHRPKPIIRTLPTKEFELKELPKVDNTKARATRPRVIEPPQFSLDDVKDQTDIDILLNYTYVSSYTKNNEDFLLGSKLSIKRPTPPNTIYQLTRDPLRRPCEMFKPLPPGLIHMAIPWDSRQRRTLVDPTTSFWEEKSKNMMRRASYMDHLQILDSLLKNDYDRRATPTNHLNNATWVYCELYIRSFGSISPATMDYEVDLYLRQKWQDERLKHPNITEALDLNDPNLVKAIWKPEVYFPNAKHAEFQFVTVPNVLVRINSDGEILYMLRLKLTFSCMMDLAKFPLDSQVCTMEVASFSKTTEELRLEWKTTNPVIMGKGLRMPQFEIVEITASECQETFQIGNYSCLVAEFYLSRSVGFHLVQSYLPTILIVVISWVSFWMDVDSVPGRTTLGVTTLLAVSSQSSGIQSGLPQVSYVKAIDVWMGTCTAFVFCALLEFTFVNYMWRKHPFESKKTLRIQEVNGRSATTGGGVVATTGLTDSTAETEKKPPVQLQERSGEIGKNKIRARSIDEMSRLCFPIAFGFFNILYWFYYLW